MPAEKPAAASPPPIWLRRRWSRSEMPARRRRPARGDAVEVHILRRHRGAVACPVNQDRVDLVGLQAAGYRFPLGDRRAVAVERRRRHVQDVGQRAIGDRRIPGRAIARSALERAVAERGFVERLAGDPEAGVGVVDVCVAISVDQAVELVQIAHAALIVRLAVRLDIDLTCPRRSGGLPAEGRPRAAVPELHRVAELVQRRGRLEVLGAEEVLREPERDHRVEAGQVRNARSSGRYVEVGVLFQAEFRIAESRRRIEPGRRLGRGRRQTRERRVTAAARMRVQEIVEDAVPDRIEAPLVRRRIQSVAHALELELPADGAGERGKLADQFGDVIDRARGFEDRFAATGVVLDEIGRRGGVGRNTSVARCRGRERTEDAPDGVAGAAAFKWPHVEVRVHAGPQEGIAHHRQSGRQRPVIVAHGVVDDAVTVGVLTSERELVRRRAVAVGTVVAMLLTSTKRSFWPVFAPIAHRRG